MRGKFMRSRLELPPGVDPIVSDDEPKGCRVKITVDEPGFADARVLLKFPYEGKPALELRSGESVTLVVKGWLRNAVMIEALPRDGDPEDPDMEGGQY